MHFASNNIKPGIQGRAGQQRGGCQGALSANAREKNTHPLLYILCLHSVPSLPLPRLKRRGGHLQTNHVSKLLGRRNRRHFATRLSRVLHKGAELDGSFFLRTE